MPTESVLLINLGQDERRFILQLLPQFDIEIEARFAVNLAEASPFLGQGNLRLVVLRIDANQQRPDQEVRRLKRLFTYPIPLFLLIPQDLANRIKDLFHAGADDYWVLPLDDVAFANRFHVVLEWGQAMMRREVPVRTRKPWQMHSPGELWRRLWAAVRHSVSREQRPPEMLRSNGASSLIGGKWERLRRLGFGSFAEVWLVRLQDAPADSAQAVAKIPHDRKLNTKFLREAAILRRLAGHRNSVQLQEIVKEEGRVVLIQEYVAGRSLQEHFEQGLDAVSKEQAFLQLVDVVAKAHQKKIMHRDIKPENIIITPTGVLKLLDFGTAKDLTRRSISNTVIGSRPYMAPEQILGKSRLASDVWSLGVILYALCTECLPFYDDNEKQLMDLILEVEPERPCNLQPDLPERLENIVLRCLQKDLSKRYRDAMELQGDLLDAFPHFGNGAALRQA
jgi:predicted Ser/Thr protein kinase